MKIYYHIWEFRRVLWRKLPEKEALKVKEALFAVLISFGFSAVFCPLLIPYLKKLKFGQQERSDGPKEHLKKAGTPTMGGIAFVLSATITSLIFIQKYPRIIPVLFVMVGFAIIGFLDDYLKVVRKNTDGLSPAMKMLGQFIIATIFLVYILRVEKIGTDIVIPFMGGATFDLKWAYIPFFYIVMLGTDNGVNFTDGVDGLCSSVTILVATFFGVVSLTGGYELTPIMGAVVGALMGFLLFNVHPAKVFMGDTGSLALGGFVGATALIMKLPLFIIIVGFIYLAEMLSVMIQVSYFKATHGKRIFRMAPIHHHFELGGWSETQVVGVFTIVTAILCILGYLAL